MEEEPTQLGFPMSGFQFQRENPVGIMRFPLYCGTQAETFNTSHAKVERNVTSTLSQRKGRAPQPSITFSCQGGG